MGLNITDFYPEKGQFGIDDSVSFLVETNEADLDTFSLHIKVIHFDKVVYTNEFILKDLEQVNGRMRITLPSFDVGGYGVKLIQTNEGESQVLKSAFDVASDHKAVPRYGFLSDFNVEDEKDSEDIHSMLKLHINLVQFYDWMYRHDTLVSEDSIYTDLMGKNISNKAIKNKIELCKSHGMVPMAYGAVYAASEEFYRQHKKWAFLDSCEKPVKFIDLFYIMNIEASCGWHQHIVSEYEKAITVMGFEGIHMDTYGYPKVAYSSMGTRITLDAALPELIDSTKSRLNTIDGHNTVIFNNVGNWPVYATAATNQDIMYVEVWEPYVTYEHIQRIILESAALTNKSMIISAYLKPFMQVDQVGAANALKLMTACVAANGATHLIMGEDQKVLTQGYYVDHYDISDGLFGDMRGYYDLIVRYSELLFNKSLKDVSMTHSYGDNEEYVFEGLPVSACGQSGKIWTVIREDHSCKLISLINLIGNDNLWNEAKNQPIPQHNLNITIQIGKELEGVYTMTPGNPAMKNVPYTVKEEERGKVLHMNIDDIGVWRMIVVRTKTW